MNLKDKFNQLAKEKRKAFIAYIPFGFPNIDLSCKIFLALQESGVDIIELGMPFSDPLADGLIIQEATSQALKQGVNQNVFFESFSAIKQQIKVPVVIMSYYNPVFRFGMDRFFKKMKSINSSAITIVDLPIEESKVYLEKAAKYSLDTIFFITPVTSLKRIKKIVRYSKGFIYYISVTGITGSKNLNLASVKQHLNNIKKITDLPVCVGFGIHSREQVFGISSLSDGVIVGSEIVKFIASNYQQKDFLNKLKNHVKYLRGA